MNRDHQLKLATIFFALVALVSVSACAVASAPSSPPGFQDADPTPTAPQEVESDNDQIAAATPRPQTYDDDEDAADPNDDATGADADVSTGNVAAPEAHVLADDLSEAEPAEDQATPERPARLVIDAIDVDAAFEYVGVTEEGNMDVPREWDNVAWYKPGVVPGDQGNAVVAGHYDSETGPAIFFEMSELAPGDQIRIVTWSGEELVFEISEVETVHVDDADTRKIFGRTQERNLNLITCEGIWDSSADMYDQRLIVYSTLVSE